jgi:hypothetical protein
MIIGNYWLEKKHHRKVIPVPDPLTLSHINILRACKESLSFPPSSPSRMLRGSNERRMLISGHSLTANHMALTIYPNSRVSMKRVKKATVALAA